MFFGTVIRLGSMNGIGVKSRRLFSNSKIFHLQLKTQELPERVAISQELLTTSYICGPGDVPLIGLTIGQLLQRAADQFGDREAAVFAFQDIRKTFHQILAEADQLAAGFLSLDLKRGDRIAIWGPNSYEWLLTQWAAARAGLILVNINPAYKANELRLALNKVEPKAIVVSNKFHNQNFQNILAELIPDCSGEPSNDRLARAQVSSSIVPSLQRVITLTKEQPTISGALRWQDVLDLATPNLISRVHNLQRHIQFDEPANIQFTSGTTGSIKGATLSHHSIVNNSYFSGLRGEYYKQDHRFCIPIPLYHSFACSAVMSATYFSAALVFPSPAYSARETVKTIHQERCTHIYGTPTMFVDILHFPELKDYDLSSLQLSVSAGASCPEELIRRAIAHLSIKDFTQAFGMTETSPASFLGMRSDSLETRSSSVGYPLDHIEVKVVDPVTQEIVPVNTTGELWTRGYNTMLYYWNDPAMTEEAVTKDRWIRSGDLCQLNERGYAKIVGRMKDMIIRGGENIYPREIEEVLNTHPDVQDAQVISVPDTRLGEEVCAWVRCNPHVVLTGNELELFCRDKLAYFKIPRYWLFKDSYPMTVTGKVKKSAMKDIAIKELAIVESLTRKLSEN